MVWNSVTSTLRAPSKRSDAVSDEVTCAIMRFRLMYEGASSSRVALAIEYRASLSKQNDTSQCSRRVWVESTEL